MNTQIVVIIWVQFENLFVDGVRSSIEANFRTTLDHWALPVENRARFDVYAGWCSLYMVLTWTLVLANMRPQHEEYAYMSIRMYLDADGGNSEEGDCSYELHLWSLRISEKMYNCKTGISILDRLWDLDYGNAVRLRCRAMLLISNSNRGNRGHIYSDTVQRWRQMQDALFESIHPTA